MKKIVNLILLFFLTAVYMAAEAENTIPGPFRSGDWFCEVNPTGITLKDYLGEADDLWIPSGIDDRPVTQLGKELFMGNLRLKHVNIPGTVTAIGSNAFANCTNLESVELSFSITRIDAGTFRNCISLKSITLPRTVTAIGDFAFANCGQISEIYLYSVRSIGESAFEGCEKLSNVVVSTKLASVQASAFKNTAWLDSQRDEFVFIGKGILLRWNGSGPEVTLPWGTVMISGTFDGNKTIESVTLPDTVRNIGKYAFRNAVNLRNINIPVYVTTIGASAFENCLSLTDISLPELFQSLDSSAFKGCGKLKSVNIPPKVKTIPAEAFADCPSLREISIPATVTGINKNAFRGSAHIILQVEKDSPAEAFAEEHSLAYRYELLRSGDFLYRIGRDGVHIVKYTGNQPEITVPGKIDGMPVVEIGTAAFQNNSCVRRVDLPASLKKIDAWAFSNMIALEYVRIPAGLKSLGRSVFAGSPGVRQIRLPRRLQEIGSKLFDSASQTKICAEIDSFAAQRMREMGFIVHPSADCPEPEAIDEQGKDDQCAKPRTEFPEMPEALRIPEGLTSLSVDLMRNAENNLILVIPDEVIEIDGEIFDGRKVIIAAEPDSYAESYASEHEIEYWAIII